MDYYIEIDKYIKNLLSKYDNTYILDNSTGNYKFIINNDSEESCSEESCSENSNSENSKGTEKS